MQERMRALIGFITVPGTGLLGSLLLANGTAAAAEPSPRVNTAHPVPSVPPKHGPELNTPAPSAPPARPSSACFDQHELGQELRQSGRLLESRATFARCASAQCPPAVQRDCQLWSRQVEAEQPSVMLRVNVEGQPRNDARVEIDGQLRPEAPAQPVKLDPGLHELHVSAPAARPLRRQLQLRPHAREQLALNLTALPEEPSRISAWSWVLGGVGLAGTAGFVAFGLSSRALAPELEQRCSPLCCVARSGRVRRRSVAATVS